MLHTQFMQRRRPSQGRRERETEIHDYTRRLQRMKILLAKHNNLLMIMISASSLFIGGMLYVIFRSDSLLMFDWFSDFGLNQEVSSLRGLYSNTSLYYWVKFNLPAALWLFSYMYAIKAIWSNQNTQIMRVFLWSLPTGAVLSEFLQLFNLLPGTFDLLDILSYILAIILFIILNHNNK